MSVGRRRNFLDVSYREQFELGIAEFNRGEFFACHDTFEELWRESRGERSLFLQGLIQSAVGIFHCMSGNTRGALSQLTRGLEKLSGYGPTFDGIDVAALIGALERLRGAIVEGIERRDYQFDPALVPTLEYRPDSLSPDSFDQA